MTRWDYREKMHCVHSRLVGYVLLSVGLVLSFHTSISPVRAATDISSVRSGSQSAAAQAQAFSPSPAPILTP